MTQYEVMHSFAMSLGITFLIKIEERRIKLDSTEANN